ESWRKNLDYMITEFEPIAEGLFGLLNEWETTLSSLQDDVIANRRNRQNRTIKQIVGHMVDSASNNTHRIVHLQYQESPFAYPNYATHGNNDRWIVTPDKNVSLKDVVIDYLRHFKLHLSEIDALIG